MTTITIEERESKEKRFKELDDFCVMIYKKVCEIEKRVEK